MEIKSTIRYIRISPQKAMLVADLVRGKAVSEALGILQYTPKKASRFIYNLINTAVSDADKKEGIDVDILYVKRICVDKGPMLKRFRARSMGRGTRILKRTCHISVVLDEA